MNFKFFSEYEAVCDMVKRLCREELAPLLEPAEEPEQLVPRVFRRWGDLRLIRVHYPEDVGGSGLDRSSDCSVREEPSFFSQAFVSYWFAREQLDVWTSGHLADLESRSRIPERSVSEVGNAWRDRLGVCFE